MRLAQWHHHAPRTSTSGCRNTLRRMLAAGLPRDSPRFATHSLWIVSASKMKTHKTPVPQVPVQMGRPDHRAGARRYSHSNTLQTLGSPPFCDRVGEVPVLKQSFQFQVAQP